MMVIKVFVGYHACFYDDGFSDAEVLAINENGTILVRFLNGYGIVNDTALVEITYNGFNIAR